MEESSEENLLQPHHNFQHQMFDNDQTLDKADGLEAPVEPPGSNRTVSEMSKGVCGEQRNTYISAEIIFPTLAEELIGRTSCAQNNG